jgi:hypothetical protein
MKSQKLPASTVVAKCQSCQMPSHSHSAFLASFYDFETYLGLSTESLYRLDLEHTSSKYGHISVEEALQPAVAREGGRNNLVLIPDQLSCLFCGKTRMKWESHGSESEHFVDAYVLPVVDEGNVTG